jgi:hypothetical protein
MVAKVDASSRRQDRRQNRSEQASIPWGVGKGGGPWPPDLSKASLSPAQIYPLYRIYPVGGLSPAGLAVSQPYGLVACRLHSLAALWLNG